MSVANPALTELLPGIFNQLVTVGVSFRVFPSLSQLLCVEKLCGDYC